MRGLVKVAAFATLLEAEQIQSVLAEQGVTAFVEGGANDPGLVHVSSIRAGIRLVVTPGEQEEARRILAELNSLPETDAWYCGACEADVDAGFVVCWSCGKHQDKVGVPRPGHAMLVDDFGSSNDQTRTFDASNPYAVSAAVNQSTKKELPIDEEAEAMLARAYRAAWIGIFSLFLLNIYSMYLLVKASVRTPHFTSEGQKRFYRSIMINILSMIPLMIFLRLGFM